MPDGEAQILPVPTGLAASLENPGAGGILAALEAALPQSGAVSGDRPPLAPAVPHPAAPTASVAHSPLPQPPQRGPGGTEDLARRIKESLLAEARGEAGEGARLLLDNALRSRDAAASLAKSVTGLAARRATAGTLLVPGAPGVKVGGAVAVQGAPGGALDGL